MTVSDIPVALVTGGSRGIGRGIAVELLERGYAVAINYFRSRQAAVDLAAEASDRGGSAVAVQGDVGLPADRQAMVNQVLQEFGRLDVLVNNAGITSPGRNDLLEATEKNWDRVFDTNLKGPFFLAQRCAKEMIRLIGDGCIQRGTLVNISSISSYAVSTNRADYCMAKAAMQMMTALFAARLAEEKIWVYEICPGVIASDMTAPVQRKYDALISEGLSPIRRWGRPEDVAKAVAALLGSDFTFTTGERINVDGGFHIRRL